MCLAESQQAVLDPRPQGVPCASPSSCFKPAACFCRTSLISLLCIFNPKHFILLFQALKWKYTFGFFKMSWCWCVCLCVSEPRLAFCLSVLLILALVYGLLVANELELLCHYIHVQNRKKWKREQYLLVMFYQEGKSLLRNSQSKLLLRVISQNLITRLPIVAREVEKVGNRMVLLGFSLSSTITWDWTYSVGTKSGFSE